MLNINFHGHILSYLRSVCREWIFFTQLRSSEINYRQISCVFYLSRLSDAFMSFIKIHNLYFKCFLI